MDGEWAIGSWMDVNGYDGPVIGRLGYGLDKWAMD